MKQTDKLLLGIVGGIILLVISVFVIVLRRPAPAYQTEDTPENIAHNYLLALRQQDYERAYGYLSPNLIHYPRTLNQFIDDVESNSWRFRLNNDINLAVESVRVIDNRADVTIQETRFYNSGLFDSYQSVSTFTIELRPVNGVWKITQADSYWDRCWHQTTNCS
jgi:hypothetical protein